MSYVNQQVLVSHEYEMLLQYPDPVWQEQTEALNNVTEIHIYIFYLTDTIMFRFIRHI